MNNLKPRGQIIAENPLAGVLEAYGITLRGAGKVKTTNRCASTEHKPMHLCVTVDTEKAVWHCADCDEGGSVIDFVSKYEGIEVPAAMRKLAGDDGALVREVRANHQAATAKPSQPAAPTVAPKIVAKYDYRDDKGNLLYQVCRLEPKSFRQRQPDGEKWKWTMEGATRVLYNLAAVKVAEFVWIVEGEKDANTLNAIHATAFNATCNVGGAGKWEESYSRTLKGKEVVICGDTDEPGRKHAAKVQEALAGHARSVRVIDLPPEYKDVTEFVASFAMPADGANALFDFADKAEVLHGGVKVPVRSMAEIEREYIEFTKRCEKVSLHMDALFPRLALAAGIRPVIPGELVTFLAGTGVGKCLGAGTPVLKASGEVVKVEAIRVGDMLMGPDSTPRLVMSTASGREEMFRVTQRNGDQFECNRSHILSLKKTGSGELVNLSVGEYLAKSAKFKHLWKLWKAPVNWKDNPSLPLPPYILGLWLGDGHTNQPTFTTGDAEIAAEIEKYAASVGMKTREVKGSGCVNIHVTAGPYKATGKRGVCAIYGCERIVQARGFCHSHYEAARYRGEFESGKGSALRNSLRIAGVLGHKHVPMVYLTSSREQRLELLAGLIDTDGYCPKRSVAVFTSTLRELAQNVMFLARSLGFMCSLREKRTTLKSRNYVGIAWNVCICGDVWDIPTRLARRRPDGTVQRKQRVSAFTVESIGDGTYFGFELDGDGLFMLGDFTVTHNTLLLQNLARTTRLTTLLFEMELPSTLTFERFVGIEMMMHGAAVAHSYKQDHPPAWRAKGGLEHIHICSESRLTVKQFEEIILKAGIKIGHRPHLVLIDYAQLIQGVGGSRYERLSGIAEDLKILAKCTNTIIVITSQVGRSDGCGNKEVGLFDAKDSGSIENSSGLVLGAWRDPDDRTRLFVKVLKNTKGKSGEQTAMALGADLRLNEESAAA